MLCPKCTTPIAEHSRFCSTCGEHLEENAQPTTAGAGATHGDGPAKGHTGTIPSGKILGDRYRVVSALGMGGMGMVYRAVDLELSVPIALKVIRGEYAHNEKILERFKREITIARKVTHKNVARIYDTGESDGIKYITMEFIEGEDLARVIERDGALPADQVVSILKQCLAGLAEAHSNGVVHRDLKPHNVMIGPTGVVHLMDFGIAMSQESRGLTGTGAILGTAEYMSPEQAEGKPVDHRADIYSLGITLYEALTGMVPFSGETQWEVIRKQMQEAPRALRKLRAETPAWLETLVLKCLEKDPSLRYQSVGEILRDIERQKATRSVLAFAPKKRTVVTIAGAFILAAAAAMTAWWLSPGGGTLLPGPGGRLSVAVLPFENQASRTEMDWLQTGLAENLATDLAQSKFIRVLTRERLGQILKNLGRDETSALEREALAGIAEYGGVQAVLSGSFISSGDTLRVNLLARDPESGEVIGSAVVPGTASEVLAMIDTLTVKAKEILSLSRESIDTDVDTAIADARTSSVEAASLFQQGVDLLYEGKNLEAVDPLERATRIDPDFALAHARLSEAFRNLGYDEKARNSSETALSRVFKAVDRISMADRAFVRAIHAATAQDRQEAIEAYTEMVEADPFDAIAAYKLGMAFDRSGQWDQAESWYEKALELDASYALAHASAGRIRILSGRPQESLVQFNKALELYRRMGSNEGEAKTLHALCEAHISLRQWDQALGYCNRSEKIQDRIGDRRGVSVNLSSKAYIYQVTGRLDEALTEARGSLEIGREIGDALGIASALLNLASIQENRGDLEEAVATCDEAIQLWRAVGDQAWEAELLQLRGFLELGLGRLDSSARSLAESGALYEQLGIDEGLAQVASDRALLALARGSLSEAGELLQSALDQWTTLDIPEGISETQYRQALVAIPQGLYGTAMTLARQALVDYEAAGDLLFSARTRAVLGAAQREAGLHGEATVTLDAALEEARSLKNPLLLMDLEAARAEAALASGDPVAAGRWIQAVCQRAPEAPGDRTWTPCPLLRGREALIRGEAAMALQEATSAAGRAAETGMGLAALEAGVVRIQAAARAGREELAPEALVLAEEIRKAGAHGLMVRLVPAAVPLLDSAGRGGAVPALGRDLTAALEAIRADLGPDGVAPFLEGGVDAEGCRKVADSLRKGGDKAAAKALRELLAP